MKRFARVLPKNVNEAEQNIFQKKRQEIDVLVRQARSLCPEAMVVHSGNGSGWIEALRACLDFLEKHDSEVVVARSTLTKKLKTVLELFDLCDGNDPDVFVASIIETTESDWFARIGNLLDQVESKRLAIIRERERILESLKELITCIHGGDNEVLLDKLNRLKVTGDVKWIWDLTQLLESAIDDLHDIESKYSKDSKGFVRRLQPFKPHKYLRDFAGDAFCVHEKSAEDNPDKKDHILCNLMETGHKLLRCLADARSMKNLEGSFGESVVRATRVANAEGSIMWFSNMKRPATYGRSERVGIHSQSNLEETAKKPLVDFRRVHLFYDYMSHPDHRERLHEVDCLMGTLLAEYLSGCDSKVLWVKGTENIYPDNPQSGKKIGSLFLLDYALHFSPSVTDRHASPSGIDCTYSSILCSDFTAEDMLVPSSKEIKDELTRLEKEQREADIDYDKDKVYDLSEPALFPLLCQHFLSLWDVQGYVARLKKLENGTEERSHQTKVVEAGARSYDVFQMMSKLPLEGMELSTKMWEAFDNQFHMDYAKEHIGLEPNDIHDVVSKALKNEIARVRDEAFDTNPNYLRRKEEIIEILKPVRLRVFPWENAKQ